MKKKSEIDLDEKINMLFDINGFIKMNVSGTSMSPLLNEGDEIKVQKVGVRDAGIGDILLFNINNTFVVHRFIGFRVAEDGKTVIVQCGDNNMEFNTVDEDSVVGKVTMIKTADGRINIKNRVWVLFNRIIGVLEYLTYLFTFPCNETDDKILLKLYKKLIYKVMRTFVHLFCAGRYLFLKT